jgi:hypothetical protein
MHLHVKMKFSSFTIANSDMLAVPANEESRAYDIDKEIQLKGLTIGISEMPCPKYPEEYEALHDTISIDVILNPLSISVRSQIPSLEAFINPSSESQPSINLSTEIDNIDLTILVAHLEIVNDAIRTSKAIITDAREIRMRYLEAMSHHPDDQNHATAAANSLKETVTATATASSSSSSSSSIPAAASFPSSSSAAVIAKSRHIDFALTLTRFAVTLTDLHDDYQEAAIAAATISPTKKTNTHTTIITFALYGLKSSYVDVVQSEGRLLIGSIKIYGINGVEILSCGGKPDEWQEKLASVCLYESIDCPSIPAAINIAFVIVNGLPEIKKDAKGVDGAEEPFHNAAIFDNGHGSDYDEDMDSAVGDENESVHSMASAQGDVCQASSSLRCVVDSIHVQVHVDTMASLRHIILQLLSESSAANQEQENHTSLPPSTSVNTFSSTPKSASAAAASSTPVPVSRVAQAEDVAEHPFRLLFHDVKLKLVGITLLLPFSVDKASNSSSSKEEKGDFDSPSPKARSSSNLQEKADWITLSVGEVCLLEGSFLRQSWHLHRQSSATSAKRADDGGKANNNPILERFRGSSDSFDSTFKHSRDADVNNEEIDSIEDDDVDLFDQWQLGSFNSGRWARTPDHSESRLAGDLSVGNRMRRLLSVLSRSGASQTLVLHVKGISMVILKDKPRLSSLSELVEDVMEKSVLSSKRMPMPSNANVSCIIQQPWFLSFVISRHLTASADHLDSSAHSSSSNRLQSKHSLCDLRVDLYTSTLDVVTTSTDLVSLTDLVHKIALKLSENNSFSTHHRHSHQQQQQKEFRTTSTQINQLLEQPIRWKSLSNHCHISCHAHIDNVSLALVAKPNQSSASIESIVTSSLLHWTTILISRGVDSPASKSARQICLQQLMQIGFPVDDIIENLDEILLMVCENGNDFNNTAEVVNLAQNMIESAERNAPHILDTSMEPIVKVIINTLSVHVIMLEYDSLFDLNIRDIFIADHNYKPIVHIGCKKLYRRTNSNKHSGGGGSSSGRGSTHNDTTTIASAAGRTRRRFYSADSEPFNSKATETPANLRYRQSTYQTTTPRKPMRGSAADEEKSLPRRRRREFMTANEDDNASVSSRKNRSPSPTTKHVKRFAFWPWYLHDMIDGSLMISNGFCISFCLKDSGWEWGSGGYNKFPANLSTNLSTLQIVRDGILKCSLKYVEVNVTSKTILEVLDRILNEYVLIRSRWQALNMFHELQQQRADSFNHDYHGKHLFASPDPTLKQAKDKAHMRSSKDDHGKLDLDFIHLQSRATGAQMVEFQRKNDLDLSIDGHFHSIDIILSVDETTDLLQANISKFKLQSDVLLSESYTVSEKVDSDAEVRVSSDLCFQDFKAVVDSLTINDLSEVGMCHHQVLWRKKDSRNESPMLTLDIFLTNDDIIKVQCVLEEVRLCFLYRFISEAISFISTQLADPITRIIHGAMETLARKIEEADVVAKELAANASATVTFRDHLDLHHALDDESLAGDEDSDAYSDDYQDNASISSETSGSSNAGSSSSESSSFDIRQPRRRVGINRSILFADKKPVYHADTLRFSPTNAKPADGRMPSSAGRSAADYSKTKRPLPKGTPRYLNSRNHSKLASIHIQKQKSIFIKEQKIDEKKEYSLQWCIGVIDLNIIDPRHSASHDMLSVQVGYGSICNMQPASPWSLPSGAVTIPAEQPPLYFDLQRNMWNVPTEGMDSHRPRTEFMSYRSWKSFAGDSFYAPTPTSRAAPHDHFPSAGSNDSILTDEGPVTTNLDLDSDETFYDACYEYEEKPLPRRSRREFDFLVHPNPNYNWTDHRTEHIQSSTGTSSPSKSDTVFRLTISLHEVDAYMTMQRDFAASPSESETPETWLFQEVSDLTRVYKMKRKRRNRQGIRSQRPSSAAFINQTWQKISTSPFNILLLIDSTKTQTRLLIADTEVLNQQDASLQAKLSMAEFYALLSAVWFDNFFEPPQEYTVVGLQLSNIDDSEICSRVDEPGKAVPPPPLKQSVKLPRYGSKEYWESIRSQFNHFVMAIVRADVEFECSMDTKYFSRPPYSLQFLLQNARAANDPNSSRQPFGENTGPTLDLASVMEDILPFASIHAKGVVVQLEFNKDSLMLSVGGGVIEVYDIREPNVSVIPLVLKIPSRRVGGSTGRQTSIGTEDHRNQRASALLYGFSSFDFGLQQNPSSLINGLYDTSIPIQYTFISSLGKNWKTNVVGLDTADLTLNNIDFVFMLSDYFSSYFRFEEYGHPGVAEYQNLPKDSIPYGGIDTRVFLSRPLISILEDPLDLASQLLCLDVDKGIFYRYTVDSHNSVRSEIRLFDLAMVLMKSYVLPEKARGLRGSAGSGRGVRTVIEYLSCGIAYHFDALKDQMDISVDFSSIAAMYPGLGEDNEEVPRSPDSSPTSSPRRKPFNIQSLNLHPKRPLPYVDFDAENVHIPAITLSHPRTIVTLDEGGISFTPDSCDIVTSYEDVVFVSKAFQDLIILKVPDEQPVPSVGPSPSPSRHPSLREDTSSPRSNRFSGRRRSSSDVIFEATTAPTVTNPDLPYNIFALISIQGVRLILVDNVLGLHLPLFQIFIEKLQLNIDYSLAGTQAMATKRGGPTIRMPTSHAFTALGGHRPSAKLGSSKHFNFDPSSGISLEEKKTTFAYSVVTIWADYFNNMKKCWEPLMEKLDMSVLYERGPWRGQGLTIRTYSAIHFNLSGSLIRAIGDTVKMIHSTVSYHMTKERASVAGLSQASDSKTMMRHPAHGDFQENENAILESSVNGVSTFIAFDASIDTIAMYEESSYSRRPSLESLRKIPNIAKKTRRSANPPFNSSFSAPKHSIAMLHPRNLNNSILHCQSHNLSKDVRVGFSIQNMTGQPLRYLQQWADGRWRVQYVNHNERSLLNFVASTTLIRNNQLIEEAFNVQMESFQDQNRSRNRKKRVGHEVALQVSGYRWLSEVQADVLSVKFHDLIPVVGRRNPLIGSRNWMMRNALKLVAEVIPHNGGRMLRLRSVFTFKNNTSHDIELLAQEASSSDRLSVNPNGNMSNMNNKTKDTPFKLSAGESFHVPLAMLYRSALTSNLKSLGMFFMRPGELRPVEDELGSRSQTQLESIDYSMQAVNLYQIVQKTTTLLNATMMDPPHGTSINGRDLSDDIRKEICCYMHAKSKRWHQSRQNGSNATTSSSTNPTASSPSASTTTAHENASASSMNPSKLPPFCYAIEVQRIGTLLEGKKDSNRVRQLQAIAGRFFHSKEQQDRPHMPIHYSIIIHPPIILENMLPLGAVFEIVHATQQKRVLWSAWVDPGKAMPIHTVTLDEPLLLLINLKYCRTPDGVIIHQPSKKSGGTLAGKLQRTLEGFLEEGEETDVSSVLLTDTVGQRIVLNIDNNEGRAGQRHITVYCPYWIINTCQYTLRLREEGKSNLPAGSVTTQLDGSRPVAMVSNFSIRERQRQEEAAKNLSGSSESGNKVKGWNNQTTYPGTRGVLHSTIAKEFAYDSDLHTMLANLSFEDIVNYAYMFNFSERSSLIKKRVSVQMDESDWSGPYSLDTVGVNQVISVDNHIYGKFEVGFKIKVAPGRLGKYTKIVRFVPRFMVVNKLENNIRLLQPVGFTTSQRELEVSAGFIRPFHLPELYGERKLRLQVEGLWTKTVPFDVDQLGSNTLMVKSSFNLASLKHVNTRGSPEYTVHFPNQEIGVWFETDWGEQNTVVKRIVDDKYAAKSTDIQPGDVLIAIDGERVTKKSFDLVMLTLKAKLREPGGCTVSFRTVEEKIRLIRERAMKSKKVRRRHSFSLSSNSPLSSMPAPPHSPSMDDMDVLYHTGSESNSPLYNRRFGSPSSPHENHRAASMRMASSSSLGSSSSFHLKPSALALPSSGEPTTSSTNDYPARMLRPKSSLENLFGGAMSDLSTAINNAEDTGATGEEHRNKYLPIRVDIRTSEACTVIVVRPVDPATESEYRIDNLSVSHIIYYKQKNVQGTWSSLGPGHSASFIWDDPFKPHKLLVLAGRNIMCPEEERDSEYLKLLGNDQVSSTTIGFLSGVAVDQSIVEIQFDEIGRSKHLPLPRSEAKLHIEVKSQGPAKTLVISPEKYLLKTELKYSTEFIHEQMSLLNEVSTRLNALVNRVDTNLSYGSVEVLIKTNTDAMLKRLQDYQENLMTTCNQQALRSHNHNRYDMDTATPPTPLDNGINAQAVPNPANGPKLAAYSPLNSMLGVNIHKQHQLSVDILEAKDLMHFVAGKLEDVYCKIYLRTPGTHADHRVYQQPKYTYVCSQTLDPVWTGQRFIFNIPEHACEELRGYSLRVAVKSKTVIQLNRFLGQTDIHLSGLKNENEVQGWFPLQPETSSFKTTVTTGIITGSIKLRLQYIHSNTGLAKYILAVHERRVAELRSYYEIQFNMLYMLRKIKFHANTRNSRDSVSNLLSNSLAITADGLISVSSNAGAIVKNATDIMRRGIEMASSTAADFVRGSNNPSRKDGNSDRIDEEEDHEIEDSDAEDTTQLPISVPSTTRGITIAAATKRNSGSSQDNRNRAATIGFLEQSSPIGAPLMSPGSIRPNARRMTGASGSQSSSRPRASTTIKMTTSNAPYRPRRGSLHAPNLANWAKQINDLQTSSLPEQPSLPPPTTAPPGLSTMRHRMLNAEGIPVAVPPIDRQKRQLLANDVMKRSTTIESANRFFTDRCLEETRRSFAHVHLTTGTLFITPMQALHLPDTKKHVSVKITYGDQTQSTFSIPPAADLSWYQENKMEVLYHDHAVPDANNNGNDAPPSPAPLPSLATSSNYPADTNASDAHTNDPTSARRDFQKTLNESLTKAFAIDTLNIRGSIRLRIVSDDFPKSKTVALLDIPVLSLLDCLCLAGDREKDSDVYDRWFPMLLKVEYLPGEGELGDVHKKRISEQSKYDNFGHGRPCIRLRMQWKSDKVNAPETQEIAVRRMNSPLSAAVISPPQYDTADDTRGDLSTNDKSEPSWKLYARLQLPLISVSLIDSIRSKEVIHISVTEVDIRHFEADKYTDTMGNISWMQVDNQLPEASAAVMLSPIQVKVHQPIVRIRIRRNNELSKHDLTSYDTIELIIQEIDLRLEQQTVLACWDLYQSLLTEMRATISSLDSGNNAYSSEDNRTAIDSLGFEYQMRNKTSKAYDILASFDLLFSSRSRASTAHESNPSHAPTPRDQEVLGSVPKPAGALDSATDHPELVTSMKFDVAGSEHNHTVYIENLFIGPIKVNMSFLTTHSIISSSDPETVSSMNSSSNAGDESESISPTSTEGLGIVSTLTVFLRQVGVVALNLTSSISDAPIFFAGYAVPHLLKTESELTQTLLDHYLLSALGQLYKIVGSLDLVGNPLALVQSLGIGVKDFFYEPAHALITNPNDIRAVGRSVVKGTISIISNTTDGMIGTGTTITRSIGRNVAKLTMDAMFTRNREELQKPVAGVQEALKRPVQDIINGLYCGGVGIVKVPYNEARRFGVQGFVLGVPKGIIGVATKPLVGVLDAVTHTGDAIREVVKATNKVKNKPLHRLRMSNLFGPDGRIFPYNMRNAFGEYVLHVLKHRDSLMAMGSQSSAGGVARGMNLRSLRPMDHDDEQAGAEIPRSWNLPTWKTVFGSRSAEQAENAPVFQRSTFELVDEDGEPRYPTLPGEEDPHEDSFVGAMSQSPTFYVHDAMRDDDLISQSSQSRRNSRSMGMGLAPPAAVAMDASNLVIPYDLRTRLQSTTNKKQSSMAEEDAAIDYPTTGGTAAGQLPASAKKPAQIRQQLVSPRISEHVIYTAIINEAPGVDLVVIISTIRIVATHYIRRHNKSGSIKELWETSLEMVGTPIFDHRGGQVTVTIPTTVSQQAAASSASEDQPNLLGKNRRTGDLASIRAIAKRLPSIPRLSTTTIAAPNHSMPTTTNPSFTIKADYEYEDVLSVLYNCILAVTGNKEEFRQIHYSSNESSSIAYNDFEEDENSVIHIGPWQYSNDDALTSGSSFYPRNQHHHHGHGPRHSERPESADIEKVEIDQLLHELDYSQWVIGVSAELQESMLLFSSSDLHHTSSSDAMRRRSRHEYRSMQSSLTHHSPEASASALQQQAQQRTLPRWLLTEHQEIVSAHQRQRELKARVEDIKRSGNPFARHVMVS